MPVSYSGAGPNLRSERSLIRVKFVTVKPIRAKPMSVEDRQESILDAALPLLRERGLDVTTREIADAAGIAEGTIFRAFPDKQAVIDAAVARVMDPAPTLVRLRAIDPGLPIEGAIREIVQALSDWFSEIMALMSILGSRERPRGVHGPDHAEASGAKVIATILELYRERLRMEPAAAAHLIRVLVFGVSMPKFGLQDGLTTADIVDFVLRGIVKEGA